MSVVFADVLQRAGDELGGFLPRLLGAILLLVVGLLVAKLAGRILRRGLDAAGVDDLAARWSVDEHLQRAGLGDSLTSVLGKVLRVALSLIVIFAALSLVGLQFLSESLNQAVLAIPKILIGVALLFAGLVLGGIARTHVDRIAFQMDLPVPAGQIAQVLVVAVFAIMAAAQIAVSTAILLMFIAVVLAGIVGTVTLSFGLGGRELARELSAGRYVQGSFRPGQRISLEEAAGTIVEIDSVSTVLRTDDGRTLRVPNHLLVERVVEVSGAAGAGQTLTDPPGA